LLGYGSRAQGLPRAGSTKLGPPTPERRSVRYHRTRPRPLALPRPRVRRSVFRSRPSTRRSSRRPSLAVLLRSPVLAARGGSGGANRPRASGKVSHTTIRISRQRDSFAPPPPSGNATDLGACDRPQTKAVIVGLCTNNRPARALQCAQATRMYAQPTTRYVR